MAMTETEYLLQCLAEECNEVAQRVSKAIRFTPEEIQPGQSFTNAERITQELIDLQGVMELLVERNLIEDPLDYRADIACKKKKVAAFMDYSRQRGCLV